MTAFATNQQKILNFHNTGLYVLIKCVIKCRDSAIGRIMFFDILADGQVFRELLIYEFIVLWYETLRQISIVFILDFGVGYNVGYI